MVHPGGRPRTVSLPPEQMIELGEQMIAWVTENNPLHLSQFYSNQMKFTDEAWRVMIECKEFSPYYQQALKLVRQNYIDGTVNPSIAQRFLRLYFKDLKEEENDTMRFKAQLDKETANAIPESVLEGQRAILDQLKGMKPKVTSIDSIDV